MIDAAIILAVLGAARAGWRRGFVFSLVDLVGFVGSVVCAVRFHAVAARALRALGIPQGAASAAGGLAIFTSLIALTALAGSRAAKAVRRPGLFTTDRVLGAAAGALLALAGAVVGLAFARALHLPFGLVRALDRSVMAPRLMDAAGGVLAWVDRHAGLSLCARATCARRW